MSHSLPYKSMALAISSLDFLTKHDFYRVGLSTPRPTPNPEEQASVYVTSGDMMTQLCSRPFTTRMSYSGRKITASFVDRYK
jgi:hypothetical protein